MEKASREGIIFQWEREREREGIQSRKVCSKNAGQISRDRAHQTKHWPFSSKSSNVARRYFLFSQNWFCYNDSHERMRSVISRKLGIQIVSLLIIYKRHHFAAQVKVYLNILLFLASPLKNPGFGPRPKKASSISRRRPILEHFLRRSI